MVKSGALRELVDLERYPLDRQGSDEWHVLVERCRDDLARKGMYQLDDFLDPAVVAENAALLRPRMASESSEQRREHNIYFLDHVDGLDPDHPALTRMQTINHTLCADQLTDTVLIDLYEWDPVREFIAATMDMPVLYVMDDPLARVNVLSYRPGEALNWHFDRSVFTTTLLLQAATEGGIFEYRRELRTEDDPRHDAVGRLVGGDDPDVLRVPIPTGALNVFRGRNTAHRVTTVAGEHERMVAVFSYYQQPWVMFTDEENLGFYGRTAS